MSGKVGGDITASRPTRLALWPHPVVKSVSFSELVEVYEIEDSEVDEFTFDNKWHDGTPKVCARRTTIHPHPARHMPSCVVWAHHMATLLFGGDPFDLPPARRILFEGRRVFFEDYPEEEDDVFETSDPIDIDLFDKYYEFYTHKPLVYWTEVDATTINAVGDGVVSWPRGSAATHLCASWRQYCHIGKAPIWDVVVGASADGCPSVAGQGVRTAADTPVEDIVGASADLAFIGAAARHGSHQVEWLVDTGASLHLITYTDATKSKFRRHKLDVPTSVIGVGTMDNLEDVAAVKLPGLQAEMDMVIWKNSMNLLSVSKLAAEHGIDFVWLQSKGLPPYLVMPNDTAVILTVEGGVPIYRSNSDLYLPEPITTKYGLPIPVSLVPRLLWFSGAALRGEQAEHEQQRHELAGVMVGGASAAEPDPVPAQVEADAVGASADSEAEANGNPAEVEVVGDIADEDTEAGHDAVGGARFSLPLDLPHERKPI